MHQEIIMRESFSHKSYYLCKWVFWWFKKSVQSKKAIFLHVGEKISFSCFFYFAFKSFCFDFHIYFIYMCVKGKDTFDHYDTDEWNDAMWCTWRKLSWLKDAKWGTDWSLWNVFEFNLREIWYIPCINVANLRIH